MNSQNVTDIRTVIEEEADRLIAEIPLVRIGHNGNALRSSRAGTIQGITRLRDSILARIGGESYRADRIEAGDVRL